MKKWLAILAMIVALPANAAYTMIIPQEAGGGTSVWASIIAKHLEKHLGEEIVLRHIPGARDIPAFNKFHNELQNDDKTIMVSHGGNAESFLIEEVDYNYKEYQPIGGMNLSIVTAGRTGVDITKNPIRFASGSGNNPDVMAFTLLACGELPSIDDYIACFKERVTFVKGMKSGDRRLAFLRGELNATRESTAAFIKHVQPLIDKGEAQLWFSHGVLDLETGKVGNDSNYAVGSFDQAYQAIYNKDPAGPMYDAYILVKQYRDALQKALWMRKGNPNAPQVQAALEAMLADEEAQAAIEKKAGKYGWNVGGDLLKAVDILQGLTTSQALKDLVKFQSEALGVKAVYKANITSDAGTVETAVNTVERKATEVKESTKETTGGVVDWVKSFF
jgi:hypothetical protein